MATSVLNSLPTFDYRDYVRAWFTHLFSSTPELDIKVWNCCLHFWGTNQTAIFVKINRNTHILQGLDVCASVYKWKCRLRIISFWIQFQVMANAKTYEGGEDAFSVTLERSGAETSSGSKVTLEKQKRESYQSCPQRWDRRQRCIKFEIDIFGHIWLMNCMRPFADYFAITLPSHASTFTLRYQRQRDPIQAALLRSDHQFRRQVRETSN